MTRRMVFAFRCLAFFALAPMAYSQDAALSGTDSAPDKGEVYRKIRSQRTVVFGQARRAGEGPMMQASSQGSGGPMRGKDFPLMIEAVLVDSAMIEAGLSYYAESAGMSSEEADAFRREYWKRNDPDRMFLVETSLQTMYAENYLDLSRYTVFIEDNEKSQHTPVRFEEKPMSSRHAEGMSRMPGQKQPMPFDWTRHEKTVFFYFPKRDFYGQPTIRKDMNELKIVFILDKDGSGKAEGRWTFSKNQP